MKTKIALSVMSVLAVVFFAWLLVEKSRNTDLNSQLDKLKQTSIRTENELAEARRISSETNGNLDRAKRSIDQLEREKSSLTADLQRNKSSLDSVRRDLRNAENDIIALKKHETEAGTAKAELDAAGKRLKELEPLESEVAALRRALAEAESRADESQRSSEWAIRDEEVEKLVSGGPEEIAKTPDDLSARIRELEARLAECESGRARPNPADETATESTDEADPTSPPEGKSEAEEKLSQAEERLKQAEARALEKIEAAETQAADWRRKLEKAKADALTKDDALTAVRDQLAAMTRERDRLRDEKREIQFAADDYDRLVKDLKGRLETWETTFSDLKDEMTLTFLDSVFFDPGRNSITPDGAKILDQVAAALKERSYHRLMVVGHTDDQPIARMHQKTFATNWELSSARAVAVTRYLAEKGGLPPERLTAAGRSCYGPAVPNDSDEHRRQNRRVELIISSGQWPIRPTVETLQPLKP